MNFKRLKQATTERRASLASKLPLLDPVMTRDHYRDFLGRFLGYYAPLETQLLKEPQWGEIGFDDAERYKTPRLEQGLLTLGSSNDDIANIPRCADLPAIATTAELLGCLYVIEGAKLGGAIGVESSVNVGSLFLIEMDLAVPPPIAVKTGEIMQTKDDALTHSEAAMDRLAQQE